jgi:membrane protein DedA with SNARE-associated domain
MSAHLPHLLGAYGYWLIVVVVGLERVGVPFPAATILIFAGAFAAKHGMNINLIVAAACAAAIIGNICGFALGRTFGNWLLFRYGHHIGLGVGRIKLGQYLFLKYGTYLVVLGQFLPGVREFGAFLSGANRSKWRTFLVANAAGGVLWSATMGFGGYCAGKSAEYMGTVLEMAFGICATMVFSLVIFYLRKSGVRLQALAEATIPGPVGIGRQSR